MTSELRRTGAPSPQGTLPQEAAEQTGAVVLDRPRLAELLAAERERYLRDHPRSRECFQRAKRSLMGGVPMPWMSSWGGGFPLYFKEAHGNRITDVDGQEYIDFCLGDTGSMTGHSPEPVMLAIRDRVENAGGLATMLPSEDSSAVGEELERRFGLPYWQFTLSATDANRFVLRMCRQIQKRPYILVFSRCYHGTVDETVIISGQNGEPTSKPGNVGPAVDPIRTTKVVEFNDVPALRDALRDRDVACVLMEPAMTNIGIVPPLPGFLEEVRRLCDETGTILINDETHTFSAGIGGCTKAWNLRPDVVTIGKALASGFPIGAYGVSASFAERILGDPDADLLDQGGVGGTLSGNPLSSAAARATLADVLTSANFDLMIAAASRYVADVQKVISSHNLPWCIAQIGARAEYRFCPEVPVSGAESAAAADMELDEYFHLFMLNRGILMTPFHNMALMCPSTSLADVKRHSGLFAQAVDALLA